MQNIHVQPLPSIAQYVQIASLVPGHQDLYFGTLFGMPVFCKEIPLTEFNEQIYYSMVSVALANPSLYVMPEAFITNQSHAYVIFDTLVETLRGVTENDFKIGSDIVKENKRYNIWKNLLARLVPESINMQRLSGLKVDIDNVFVNSIGDPKMLPCLSAADTTITDRSFCESLAKLGNKLRFGVNAPDNSYLSTQSQALEFEQFIKAIMNENWVCSNIMHLLPILLNKSLRAFFLNDVAEYIKSHVFKAGDTSDKNVFVGYLMAENIKWTNCQAFTLACNACKMRLPKSAQLTFYEFILKVRNLLQHARDYKYQASMRTALKRTKLLGREEIVDMVHNIDPRFFAKVYTYATRTVFKSSGLGGKY